MYNSRLRGSEYYYWWHDSSQQPFTCPHHAELGVNRRRNLAAFGSTICRLRQLFYADNIFSVYGSWMIAVTDE